MKTIIPVHCLENLQIGKLEYVNSLNVGQVMKTDGKYSFSLGVYVQVNV